jgi:hypothetical protein
MPLVKHRKFILRDYSDVALWLPEYEVPLAKIKHRSPRRGAKVGPAGPLEEVSIAHDTPPALLTRDVTSVEREWSRINALYDFDTICKVYPSKDDFVKAVEKAMISQSSAKQSKPEIMTKYKSMGLTLEQAESCVRQRLFTVEAVKTADLATLATALQVEADKAMDFRDKWSGEESSVLTLAGSGIAGEK